jgi:hypothetical protein
VRPGCTKPAVYDRTHEHTGCTEDWCVADPLPSVVDPDNREQVRRLVLGSRYHWDHGSSKVSLRDLRRYQRMWDRVK